MDESYRLAMQEQVAQLDEELTEIKRFIEEQEYMPTIVYRATERNLQLLVEACIGIAKHTLKSAGKTVPSEARQVFEKLRAEGYDNSSIPWKKVVGMRNALVHDYLNVDRERILELIKKGSYCDLFDFCYGKLRA